MIALNYRKTQLALGIILIQMLLSREVQSQSQPQSDVQSQSEVPSRSIDVPRLSLLNDNKSSDEFSPTQRPTKRIYYTGGAKIGMFFVQGGYTGNQMISIEPYGKYVGENFFAELSLPIRFKTSPAFTDIGLDVNVLYPFLGNRNRSEFDPYVGGGMGLHVIAKDDSGPDSPHITARGGLGLNAIAGIEFFKNYDFNVIFELKYFIFLREFGDKYYNGIGLNIGVTLPHPNDW
jgi:hypothetical protein